MTRSRDHFPSRDAIIQFISDHPGKVGKRELARAFGIKGSAKNELKRLLRQLADEGVIERRGKRLSKRGELPRVCTLDITARDSDGGLLAIPVAWDIETDGKPPVVRIKSSKDRSGAAGIGHRVLARVEKIADSGVEYQAQVMKRFERKRDVVLGVIRETDRGARLEPASRRQSELLIPDDKLAGARAGDLVEVAVGRGRGLGQATASVAKIVGKVDSEKAISMIALHAHDIPYIFPQTVIDEAERVSPVTSSTPDYEDWTEIPFITIDPADAKDHDDAVYAEADSEASGGWIVTVAIADVAGYVSPDSAIDQEARKRGNSVYFPDRVVPMLPERISNDLCSLREAETRPAIAVRMWFAADGRKRRHRFHRVIIRSRARLSYPQTQAAIDGFEDEKTAPITESVLRPLWQAWRCMGHGRAARSPLELALVERKVLLKDDGSVDRVVIPERLDAHRLIEEFMIQANVCAAETLEARNQKLVYRIHDAPSLDKLESLREFLRSMNLSLARAGNVRASHFNSILDSVSGSDRQELVNQVILRSQSQAEYSPANIGHFGLNLMRYAHFTSPIRRYADLVVHRALITSLGLGKGGITSRQEEELEIIAADISVTERRAMAAERETIDRLVANYLSERIGDQFVGRINGVTKAGLFVTLADSGADGFIPISQIGGEYFHFDEANHILIGDESGLAYQIGQEVEVKLIEVAPIAGALRFEMLSQGIAFGNISRTRPSNKRSRKFAVRTRQQRRRHRPGRHN